MSIEFLISQVSGKPLPFDHSYENEAMHRVAKNMWQKFHNIDMDFLVIFNVQNPAIDMLIVSERGMGILDFKHFSSDVAGKADEAWYYVDSHEKVLAGGNHMNPLQQVKAYKAALVKNLEKYKGDSNKFKSLRGVKFDENGSRIQGCVVPTLPHIDLSRIELRPHNNWFAIRSIEDVPEWASSLTFGSRSVSLPEIRIVIKSALSVDVYSEIEQVINNQKSYGILRQISDGVESASYSLNQEQMTLGRASNNSICLSKHDAVSGQHAVINNAVDGSTYIRDSGSTNGTYVNGIKIGKTFVRIKHGDSIILGKHINGKPVEGSCYLKLQNEILRPEKTRHQNNG